MLNKSLDYFYQASNPMKSDEFVRQSIEIMISYVINLKEIISNQLKSRVRKNAFILSASIK
jgi:hypothetical protein